MESFGDKLRAFSLALALHLLVVFALLVGLWWTHEARPVAMPGPVIEATLVGPTAAPKAHVGATKARSAPVKPAPEPPKPEPPKAEPPAPEPPKPQPPKPEPAKQAAAEVQRQDQIEREKVAAIAEQKAEQEKKEQDEKHHQDQVLLEQQQKQQKLKAEQQKQLADIRKQREAADKNAKLERQKLAQLEDLNKEKADQQATPAAEHEAPVAATGAGGKDNDLMARYSIAIQIAVTQNWNRPDNADIGLRCTLNITQIPGGDVIGVTIGSPCNADAVTRTSIEQAVMRAAPLPYQGYEKVFERNIKFNFKYDG